MQIRNKSVYASGSCIRPTHLICGNKKRELGTFEDIQSVGLRLLKPEWQMDFISYRLQWSHISRKPLHYGYTSNNKPLQHQAEMASCNRFPFHTTVWRNNLSTLYRDDQTLPNNHSDILKLKVICWQAEHQRIHCPFTPQSVKTPQGVYILLYINVYIIYSVLCIYMGRERRTKREKKKANDK